MLLILSADHIIRDLKIFSKVLNKVQSSIRNNLVTFGIIPKHPETGYGYIESEFVLDKNNIKGSRIKRFIEKPNKISSTTCKSKKYTWNSGMFIFKNSLIIKELNKYAH